MYIDYANSHKHALLVPICEWLEILARRGVRGEGEQRHEQLASFQVPYWFEMESVKHVTELDNEWSLSSVC
jgi:hypothetical protein